MMRPTPRFLNLLLIAFVAALLPALWREDAWMLWAVVVGLLFLALVVDLVLTPGKSTFDAQLDCPSQMYIGNRAAAVISLQQFGGRVKSSVDAVLDVSGVFEDLDPWRGLVLAEGKTVIHFELNPKRRGCHFVETFWLRWRGPLGLFSASMKTEFNHEVLVVPNLGHVQDAAIRFMSNPEFLSGIKAERYLGEGSEFDRMREFQQGMDQRNIDWKASARHRRLLARQYRLERNHQIVISFDTGHLMSEPIDGMPRLDHAVNAGLLLAWCSLKAQDRVVIHAFDDKVRHFGDAHVGVKSMTRVQQATSRFDYGTGEANYTLAMTDLAVRLKRRSLVVVLTEFADSITAEIMVENLGRLARKHLVLFVALRDKELMEFEDAAPLDVATLGRSVVATELLEERAKVMRKLELAGVLCLDARPKDLSADLVSAYLDIKAKERI